jgi:hypothetical protein
MGYNIHKPKLSESDIMMINQLLIERKKRLGYANELTIKNIAKKFDVNINTIFKISNGDRRKPMYTK